MDCINVAGRLLGHKLTNPLERDSLRQKTKKIWVKHFPDEPFDLAESKKHSLQEFPNGLVSKIVYNIEEAASRQRVFYYQVCLNEFFPFFTFSFLGIPSTLF